MQQKITPHLWFNDNAEEAAEFYTSLLPNSRIHGSSRYVPSAALRAQRPAGSTMNVLFQMAGCQFMGLNGGPLFTFNPSVSFVIACDSEDEIHQLWDKLSHGGQTLMSLAAYPFAKKYGWCNDRFGLSWQLILEKRPQKIRPALLFTKDLFGQARAALDHYTATFPDSSVETVFEDPKSKALAYASFALAGQEFMLMESSLNHEFGFSPAISFLVSCATQAELDQYWQKLSANPKAEQCGWLNDKFGLAWQIVPDSLDDMILKSDDETRDRVMQVILQMKKLDLKAIAQAGGRQ